MNQPSSSRGSGNPTNPPAKVKEYWDANAKKHLGNLQATSRDPLLKDLELQVLRKYLDSKADTLEAGCGNGFNLIHLSSTLRGRLVGFDFAPAMIESANKSCEEQEERHRFSFKVADVLGNLDSLGKFDQIYTDRCLINLSSLELQLQAVGNLAQNLNPGGLLILVEGTQQGQECINELRKRVELDPINYHWHNLYLDEDRFLAGIPPSLKCIKTENFSSLYYIISRVFNAKLTPEGQDPDYLSEINKISCLLPFIGDHGPFKLFMFEKVS